MNEELARHDILLGEVDEKMDKVRQGAAGRHAGGCRAAQLGDATAAGLPRLLLPPPPTRLPRLPPPPAARR